MSGTHLLPSVVLLAALLRRLAGDTSPASSLHGILRMNSSIDTLRSVAALALTAMFTTMLFRVIFATCNGNRLETACQAARVAAQGTMNATDANPETWAAASAVSSLGQAALVQSLDEYFRFQNLASGLHSNERAYWGWCWVAVLLLASSGACIGWASPWLTRRGRTLLDAARGTQPPQPQPIAFIANAAMCGLVVWPLLAAPIWYITADRAWDSLQFMNDRVEGPAALSLAIVTLLIAATSSARMLRARQLLKSARQAGACETCGYMIGIEGAVRCPECGKAVADERRARRAGSHRRTLTVGGIAATILVAAALCFVMLPDQQRRSVAEWLQVQQDDSSRAPSMVLFRPGESVWMRWQDACGVIFVQRDDDLIGQAPSVVGTRFITAFWAGRRTPGDWSKAEILACCRNDPAGTFASASVMIGKHEIVIYLRPSQVSGELVIMQTQRLEDVIRYAPGTLWEPMHYWTDDAETACP